MDILKIRVVSKNTVFVGQDVILSCLQAAKKEISEIMRSRFFVVYDTNLKVTANLESANARLFLSVQHSRA